MAGFITNYIQNTAASMLTTGITAAGNMAGNAVGGVGGLIEHGGRSVGDGVAGGIKSMGDYINSYGDRAVGATAPGSGGATAVKKTAVNSSAPAAKKALPASSAPKKALPAAAVPKALPPAGGKPKALPAPPSVGLQGNKRTISAASKPKLAGSSLPGVSKPVSSVKPPISKPALSKSPAPTGLSKTTLPPKKDLGLPNGKVKISSESRPKPAGAAKTVVKR